MAVFVAALYLSTLAPTVLHYSDGTRDAAAIPTTAYVLGIMHSRPGIPPTPCCPTCSPACRSGTLATG